MTIEEYNKFLEDIELCKQIVKNFRQIPEGDEMGSLELDDFRNITCKSLAFYKMQVRLQWNKKLPCSMIV